MLSKVYLKLSMVNGVVMKNDIKKVWLIMFVGMVFVCFIVGLVVYILV